MSDWKLTDNLLVLDNGRELLLANTRRGGLLYFVAGRDFILGVMDRATGQAGEATPRASLPTAPLCAGLPTAPLCAGLPTAHTSATDRSPGADDEPLLLQALEAHGVLIPAGTTEEPEVPAREDPTAPKDRMTLHLLAADADDGAALDAAQRALERAFRAVTRKGALEVVFLGLNGDETAWNRAREAAAWAEQRRKRLRRRRPVFVFATSSTRLPDAAAEALTTHSARLAFDWTFDQARSEAAPTTLETLAGNEIPAVIRLHLEETDLTREDELADWFRNLPPAASVEMLPDSSNRPAPGPFAEMLLHLSEATDDEWERLGPVNGFLTRLVHGGSGWFCGMPFGAAVAVDSTGAAYPCYQLCDERRCLGAVTDPGRAFARSHLLNALLYETHVDNLSDCARCQWRLICAGGCPAMADRGDGHGADGHPRAWWCDMCKTLLPAVTWKVARKLSPPQSSAGEGAPTATSPSPNPGDSSRSSRLRGSDRKP